MNEAPARVRHPPTDWELGTWIREKPLHPTESLEIRWKSTGGQEGVCKFTPDSLLRDVLRDAMAKSRPADDERRAGIQRPRMFEAILLLREIS